MTATFLATARWRAVRRLLPAITAMALAACGGGGGDNEPPPPITPVVQTDFAAVAGKACNGPAQSGWCWQRPLPQGDNILDYAYVDVSRGWAVGDGGTLLATQDGGVSWNAQLSGTQQGLSRVVFASPLVGWVAGSNGELLKTADAGASWQRVSFGRNDSIQTLGATDAATAWLTTSLGDAFITTSGGAQWRAVPPPPGGAFRILPIGAGDIWALAPFFGAQPSLWHSLDAGATWVEVALPPVEPGLTGYVSDLQSADASHLLAIGFESGSPVADPTTYVSRQMLRISADRGVSWRHVALPSSGVNPVFSLAEGATVYAFSFGANLQRTRDDGTTWVAVPLPTGSASYFVSFKAMSAERLLVVDGIGQAWLSTDGGARWNLRSAQGASAPTINSLWFFDRREGLAISDDGSAVRTSDGGQTWVTSAGTGFGWSRVQFMADGSVGWVISNSGTIYRSTDKGRTWLAPVGPASAPLNGITDFHFIDALRGWAISPYVQGAGGGTIFTTLDGGMSWQSVVGTATIRGFVAIRFADAMRGTAVGPAGIGLVTSDGGLTWSPRPTGVTRNLRRLSFVDATTVLAVGDDGVIVRSVDRGETWKEVASPARRNLNDVRFLSAGVGHAVGDGGTQLVSQDGGVSWSALVTGVEASMQAAFFIDAQTGWIAGGNGSILATASGGR